MPISGTYHQGQSGADTDPGASSSAAASRSHAIEPAHSSSQKVVRRKYSMGGCAPAAAGDRERPCLPRKGSGCRPPAPATPGGGQPSLVPASVTAGRATYIVRNVRIGLVRRGGQRKGRAAHLTAAVDMMCCAGRSVGNMCARGAIDTENALLRMAVVVVVVVDGENGGPTDKRLIEVGKLRRWSFRPP